MTAHKMSLRNHEVVKQSLSNQIAASLATLTPRNDRRGFTLIELMVVIAIIAILISIGISSYSVLQKGGRDAKRKSDLATIQSALEQYHADQNYYPGSISFGNKLEYGSKTYLVKIPTDPYYSYIALPNFCTNCTSYSLCAKMENPISGSSLTNCTSPANYEVRPP